MNTNNSRRDLTDFSVKEEPLVMLSSGHQYYVR